MKPTENAIASATAADAADAADAVKAALEERLAVVADREFYARDPSGHLAALREASARLDEAVQKLPRDTDPRLLHFLERQSYLKALDFLKDAGQSG